MTTTSLFSVLRLLFLLTLTGLQQSAVLAQTGVSITTKPENVTVVKGGNVTLSCGISGSYSGSFEWRAYPVGPVGGAQVYLLPPYTVGSHYNKSKIQRVGDYGLEINNVEWMDGVMYGCNYLFGDVSATASVVVIDHVVASMHPRTFAVGDLVSLTCQVTFGGPDFGSVSGPDIGPNSMPSGPPGPGFGPNSVLPISDQFPQLEMSLGSTSFDVSAAPVFYEPGKPGIKPHRIIKKVNYTAISADMNKELICSVSTRSPKFLLQNSTFLKMYSQVNNVTINTWKKSYMVNDVINCSASGFPTPNLQWRRVHGSNDTKDNFPPIHGPYLHINKSMKGENTWKCMAVNNFTMVPVEREISFMVVDETSVQETSTSDDAGRKVGLGVGLAFGLAALVAIIVIVLVIVMKRRAGSQNVPEKKKAAPPATKKGPPTMTSYTTVPSESRESAPPIYQPPRTDNGQPRSGSPHGSTEPASAPLLDQSGFADLGHPFNCQESLSSRAPSVASSGQHGPNQQPPRSKTPSVAGSEPVGFADLGGQSNGRRSNPSLNRSADSSRISNQPSIDGQRRAQPAAQPRQQGRNGGGATVV